MKPTTASSATVGFCTICLEQLAKTLKIFGSSCHHQQHQFYLNQRYMNQSVQELFDRGYSEYQEGKPTAELIPLFKTICDRAPKNGPAWTSLAWLYLLEDKPQMALKAAKRAVKVDRSSPQSRVNLVLAMLETDQKGVREHIEATQQIMALDSKIREDINANLQDGLKRKPGWKNLERVIDWLN